MGVHINSSLLYLLYFKHVRSYSNMTKYTSTELSVSESEALSMRFLGRPLMRFLGEQLWVMCPVIIQTTKSIKPA